jgi:hypothetical protein
MSKVKDFILNYKEANKVEKSYDYRDQYVIIDALDQQAAEASVPENFLQATKEVMANQTAEDGQDASQGIYKVHFMKGCMTLARKAENLYNGHFEDNDGQVVEKLSDVTLEIALKTLMVKGFIDKVEYDPQPVEVANQAQPVNPQPEREPMTVRVKYGDFEFEMRKSVKNFVSDFKKAKSAIPGDELRKAIKAYRRNSKYQNFTNDIEAARFVLDNWEQEKENFNQILFVVQQNK